MTTVDRWQLPDGVEEVLPARAQTVERLRRRLLDLPPFRLTGAQARALDEILDDLAAPRPMQRLR